MSRKYEISFNLVIREAGTFGAPEVSFHATELAPEDADPVEYLRRRFLREFRRVTADWEPAEEDK